MSPELTLLVGLLVVLALPGLLIGLADLLGSTETHHRSRTAIEIDVDLDRRLGQRISAPNWTR